MGRRSQQPAATVSEVVAPSPHRSHRRGRGDRPHCRPDPDPLARHRNHPAPRHEALDPQRRPQPHHQAPRPTAAVPPSHVAGSSAVAHRAAVRGPVGSRGRQRRRRRRPRRRPRHRVYPLRRSSPLQRRPLVPPLAPGPEWRALLRGEPSPGTSDTPGTPTKGSTPPGGQVRAGPARSRRNIGGDGRDDRRARRARPRRPRRGRPVNRPRWAALGPSSGPMIPAASPCGHPDTVDGVAPVSTTPPKDDMPVSPASVVRVRPTSSWRTTTRRSPGSPRCTGTRRRRLRRSRSLCARP